MEAYTLNYNVVYFGRGMQIARIMVAYFGPGIKYLDKEPMFPFNPEESDVVGIKLKFQIYNDFEVNVEVSTYNSGSRTITLGKYNDKGKSYIINAIENESTYFSTVDEIWNAIDEAGFSKEEVWKLNEKVLDNAIAKGKTIEFSHNPIEYRKEESYFRLEIDYLEANGYEFKEIGGKWYASK